MSKKREYSRFNDIPHQRVNGPITDGCMVLEGGSFRGFYSWGILDVLMMNGINLKTVIGVSAGALGGASYATGQVGRTARFYLKYRHDSRYVGRQAIKRSGNFVNVGFCCNSQEPEEPIDYDCLRDGNRRFVAVTTNCITGKPEYRDIDNCKDFPSAVEASATMPFLSPPVDVDGVPCFDGGVSSSIPFEWALDQGFEKIVIIKTQDRQYRKKVKKSPFTKLFYGKKFPKFAEAFNRRPVKYNMECDMLEEMEKAGRVFVIAPTNPVNVGRLDGDLEKMGQLYWQGYEDGIALLEKIKEYLNA